MTWNSYCHSFLEQVLCRLPFGRKAEHSILYVIFINNTTVFPGFQHLIVPKMQILLIKFMYFLHKQMSIGKFCLLSPKKPSWPRCHFSICLFCKLLPNRFWVTPLLGCYRTRRQDSVFDFVTDIYQKRFCVSPRLRCPIKSSGLRFPSILSTAALKAPALHLPPAACRGFDPTSYARRTHNPEPTALILPTQIKKAATRMGDCLFCGAYIMLIQCYS